MPERRYDEKELADILRIAAEVQNRAATTTTSAAGLTLSEIEKVAAEVGLDPKSIAQAAERLDNQPVQEPRRFRLLGAPAQISLERSIEGTLDEAGWEELVAQSRKTFSGPGVTSEVGSAREWLGGSDLLTASISASPRAGRTKLRLNLRQEDGIAASWIVGFLVGFVGACFLGVMLSINHVEHVSLFVTVFVALVTFATNRYVARWSTRNRELCQTLLESSQELASQPAARTLSLAQETTNSELRQF